MQKIILDTNVLVSGLIQTGYPCLIINNLFLEQKVDLCISDALLQEYYEVLNRKKFSRYPDFILKAELFLAEIEEKGIKFSPQVKLNIIGDKDDNKLLELAIESSANFLITGNTNDFTFKKYKGTQILTPLEYWKRNQH